MQGKRKENQHVHTAQGSRGSGKERSLCFSGSSVNARHLLEQRHHLLPRDLEPLRLGPPAHDPLLLRLVEVEEPLDERPVDETRSRDDRLVRLERPEPVAGGVMLKSASL